MDRGELVVVRTVFHTLESVDCWQSGLIVCVSRLICVRGEEFLDISISMGVWIGHWERHRSCDGARRWSGTIMVGWWCSDDDEADNQVE